jgi:hypothetical protein
MLVNLRRPLRFLSEIVGTVLLPAQELAAPKEGGQTKAKYEHLVV